VSPYERRLKYLKELHSEGRRFFESKTDSYLHRLCEQANKLGRNYPPSDIQHFNRIQLIDVLYTHISSNHVEEAILHMPIQTKEEIRGKLYELNTVDIRWVLRQLHNNVKSCGHTGVAIASMQHNTAFQTITGRYSDDDIERMLEKNLERHSNQQKSPPMWPSDNASEMAEDIKREHGIDAEKKVQETAGEEVRKELYGDSKQSKAELLKKLLEGDLDAAKVKALIDQAIQSSFSEHTQVHNQLGGRVLNLETKSEAHRAAMAALDGRMKDLGGDVVSYMEKMAELVKKTQTTNVIITFPDGAQTQFDTAHRALPKLIKYLGLKRNVFLTGPAGSGKSTGIRLAAQALKLDYDEISVCSQTTKTDFFGYMDAVGTYRGTSFRRIYEGGGVFNIDEIDAGSANVLAVLNQALSGDACTFPDKRVPKHPEFRCGACGNTWGTGKTIQYVGRNAIDMATLNRFVKIHWDYDEAFETKITGLPDWSFYVQKCRAEIKRRGINFIISPRASIDGAVMLRGGVDVKDVLDDVLFAGLDPDIRKQLPDPPVISIGEDQPKPETQA
jgi:cobaltochelatase CobS